MSDAEKHFISEKLYLPVFQQIFCYFNMGIFFNFMPRAGKQILYTDTTV